MKRKKTHRNVQVEEELLRSQPEARVKATPHLKSPLKTGTVRVRGREEERSAPVRVAGHWAMLDEHV